MLILQANNIQKSYGARTILDFPQLLVYEGDKIGVVGDNGAGKSTLLGILSGDIPPDTGSVTGDFQVCYIRQLGKRDPHRSGGENAKSAIQRETGQAGWILFADEPTANLDADGQAWVRQRLAAAGTLLLVSHDRELLDLICNKILEIENGALTEYAGSCSDYEAAVKLAKEQQLQDYATVRQKRSQLEDAMRVKEQKVARQRQKKRREYANNGSEARLGGHKRAASMKKQERDAKVLEARVKRLPTVEKPREAPALRIDFSLTKPPGNKNVITAEGVAFSYGENAVLRDVSFVVPNCAKIAVTGKNGAGKSTLLSLIYEGHKGIAAAPKLRMGFLYQSFENLDLDKSILDNVMFTSVQDQASVRSVLAGLLFRGDEIHKKAAALSGGERMRLSLAKLLTCEANALLLDEPTNYLDLRSVEAVQNMVAQYPGTVLLVSHDERFVRETARERLHIEDGRIRRLPLAETQQSPPSSTANRTLLELRRTQLVAAISSAGPEQKSALEAEYHKALEALRALE